MQLADLFASSLVGQADEVAIEHERADGGLATLRFGELHARSNRLAHTLARRGLRAGDRVGVYLSNRVEFVDLLLACVKLGLVLVPINILYREREIAHILADAQPRIVVTTREAFPAFEGAEPARCDRAQRGSGCRVERRCAGADRRRCAGRDRLHVWHDRALQGRGAVAQQLPREHRESHRVLADHCERSLSGRAAAVPRPRPRERAHDLAGQRLPDAAGRAVRRAARR